MSWALWGSPRSFPQAFAPIVQLREMLVAVSSQLRPSLQIAPGQQGPAPCRIATPSPGHVPSQWLAFIWTQRSHPLPYFVIALCGHPGPRAPLTMGASVGIPLWNSFSLCSLLLSAPFLTGAPLPSTPQ